jgi:hypothetical protein
VDDHVGLPCAGQCNKSVEQEMGPLASSPSGDPKATGGVTPVAGMFTKIFESVLFARLAIHKFNTYIH